MLDLSRRQDPIDRAIRRQRAGDHTPRPDRCAWVVDASAGQACPKLLKRGLTGHCPKHARVWVKITGG